MALDASAMKWTREPKQYSIASDKVEIITEPHTDLWQRTYYHFRNDNAPVLQISTDEKFFSFVVKTEFEHLTKGNSPQAERVSLLLQRLEVSLEEAKNNKLGFSMTRQEGLEIIRREGLQRHNVDGVQEYRPGDTVIKQEEGYMPTAGVLKVISSRNL